jgi:SAM-dependent methyltransferase
MPGDWARQTIQHFGHQWSDFHRLVRSFRYDQEFLHWIYPYRLADFRGKTVLDAGCGLGIHAAYVARAADAVYAVDASRAIHHGPRKANLYRVQADLAALPFKKKFDIIYSVGVLHHTGEPSRVFAELVSHLSQGGILIAWVYGAEGNWAARLLAPIRKCVTSRNRLLCRIAAHAAAAVLFSFRKSAVFRRFVNLPQIEQWGYLRTFVFCYDQLSPRIAEYFTRERIERFRVPELTRFEVLPVRGNSYTIIAQKGSALASTGAG